LKLFRSFKNLQNELFSSNFSCEELVDFYLKKINQSNNNSFVETFNDSALSQARVIDRELSVKKHRKLSGLIVAIKDNICYEGHAVTASSSILKGFKSVYSATVVSRLIEHGAIIIGRLNCDEFAMGSSNEKSTYGPVKNPFDNNKVPGGSSGGSAAAVSEGLCLVSLGSDTGGSIRQPAAFCGVIGLKPTYSRVSRYGLIAYASSFDQIGPIANNIEDIALVLEVISGKDKNDSTSSSLEVPNFNKVNSKQLNKKIAYLSECINHPGLDHEIRQNFLLKIDELKHQGFEVEPISFPLLDYLVATYYVLSTAEASSNLARFDGINYANRTPNAKNLNDAYVLSRNAGFGEEVKRRIMLGTFVLSSGYHDAYFTKAQKIRRKIRNTIEEIFKTYDYVLTPTTPHVAFDIGDKNTDPTQMYLEDIFTVLANLSGNPAISMPMNNHSSGLPYGFQIMGRNFDEEGILSFSKNYF